MSSKRDAIFRLWLENFGDSEEFVRFYFDRKYDDRHALLYEAGGEATAAALMLPYRLRWQGGSLDAAYISGACTRREARNRGIMSELLREGFRQMYERGTELTFLIPAEGWLFDYYGRMGYGTVFRQAYAAWEAADAPASERVGAVTAYAGIEETPVEEAHAYFTGQLEKKACFVEHDRRDFQAVVEEHYLSGGKLFLARGCQQQIQGIAFALPEEGQVQVKEIACDSQGVQQALLQEMARMWKGKKVLYRTEEGEGTPYGMARLIRVKEVLERLAAQHPDLCWTVKVRDDLLSENNGTYVLAHGACARGAEETTESISIDELTRQVLCFQGVRPYMSLMMD